jgi:hypothetical protein
MSIAMSPMANIKPPKAFLLLGSILLPPLAFPGFTGMVNSLGAGGTYYLLWEVVGGLELVFFNFNC